MPEPWSVYNCFRNDTGRLASRGARLQLDEYLLVVNVWLRNAQGEYFIPRRSPERFHSLFWEATGGSVLAGETSVQGAVREMEEELGIRWNPEAGVLPCIGHRQYDGCPDIPTAMRRSKASRYRVAKPWTLITLLSKKSGAWFNPVNSFQWRNSIACTNWGYDGIAALGTLQTAIRRVL